MTPGSRIGPYEVVSALGAGGMGEVYRARDTKLNRDVAIKVLPATFANDPERSARFQREAQVLAAMNHPNIATIYGVEQNALVMELVDGDDLKGPVTLAQALAIARQIAEALEYAHSQGIVHRDLKPANIKVKKDGTVKLLDFGLAKAFEDPSKQDMPANSPTLSLAATRNGVILGTAAYMSPEQARGEDVDKRTDIWAFGVVLFELLSGKSLYGGRTTSDILAAVLLTAPDWSKLPAGTPAPLRRLLRRCLQREVRDRLQDIGDARLDIAEAISAPEESVPPAAAPVPAQRANIAQNMAWTVAAILGVALAAAAFIAWRATRPAPPAPLMQLSVELGSGATLEKVRGGGALALSPDGTRLAVIYRGPDGRPRLGTRLLNQTGITPLNNTNDASDPFFSPDGQWIGFFADGHIKKISVDGGAAISLCEVTALRGASWGDDGNIVLTAFSGDAGLSRVSGNGGKLEALTRHKPGEHTHRWAQVLPGSEAILFTASTSTNYDEADVEVVVLKTGERKVLQHGGFSPRYLDSGHLVYVHQSTLFAAPFNLKRLELTGPPVPVLDDVNSGNQSGGDFAFSRAGSLVYISGHRLLGGARLSWLDNTGKRQPLHNGTSALITPRLSPDGKRLAFSLANGLQGDIWVKDLERDTLSRLTFLPGLNSYPVWTPDGKSIVFYSSSTASGIYWIRSDSSGQPQRLTNGTGDHPYSFSPDGKRLALDRQTAGNYDIWTAPMEGDADHPKLGAGEAFVTTPFSEIAPAFSPDGHWLAYCSSETGTLEVYVRPFPGPGGKWQVSTGGGCFPHWSSAGHELLFETQPAQNAIMTVTYSVKGGTFTSSTPKVWVSASFIISTIPIFDLAPDGKRIAALLRDEEGGPKPFAHVALLLNFFDELRRKAPPK